MFAISALSTIVEDWVSKDKDELASFCIIKIIITKFIDQI